ncbi:MAG: RNA polymerase sigma factor [Thermoleophilia bacterium]|nr:RNA polymerase sigma factor [Thermoleophilia bacterium]
MARLAQALRESASNPEAFGFIFDDQFGPILDRLVRRVFDAEIAVDVAAETLAEAFTQRNRFRGSTDAEVVNWLNAIADRKLARFYRKDAVEKRALRRLGIDSPHLTEEEHHEVLERAGMAELRGLVRSELRALPDAQRAALTLRVVDELPYSQVASRLGITEEAARARVARALRALRHAVRTQPFAEETP